VRVGARSLVGVLGAAAVVLGLAVVAVPGLVAALPGRSALPGGLGGAGVTTVMLLGGLLAIGLGLAAARGTGSRTILRGPTAAGERFTAATGRDARTGRLPESPGGAGTRVLGGGFDRQLDAATAGDDAALAAVREGLRERAVATLASGNHEPAAARQAVDAGTWTEDRVAAGFLAAPHRTGRGDDGRSDETGGDTGARRGRAWRRGPPARERVERTIAALEGIEGGRP
jgi:hypothetical protein